jgi:hypothetical protein
MTDINTSPTAAVFAAFIEADAALKELPKTREQLDLANQLLHETDKELRAEQQLRADRDAEIAQLRADLASKEAALSDATKSRDSAHSLLDGLRGLLGHNVSHDSPVQPSVTAEAESGDNATPSPEATNTPEDQPQIASHDPELWQISDHIAATATNPTEVANAATVDPTGQDAQTSISQPGNAGDNPVNGSADAPTAPTAPRQPWTAKPYWVNWADWRDLHNGEVPDGVTDLNHVA